MAAITEDKELELTAAEAVKFVKNATGKVRFQVRIEAYLPCGEGQHFPGMTYLSISRADMLKIIPDICSPTLEARGAKVTLRLSAPGQYGDLSFICLG